MAKHIDTIPLIGSLNVQHFLLDNGLNVAIAEDSTTPIFTYQTWFRAGSADEIPGKQGLAHLFEHMMFRKTSRRDMGEWERHVNINGGTNINAYTSRDQTVYFFTFPNEKLQLAADLESDRMSNLVIETEMFETEKGAVLTERNRGLDNPGRFLWEELYKVTYKNHPYRYSIIGEEQSIREFTVNQAQEFYKTYYSPNNALIIVVGDVHSDQALSAIEHHYCEINQHSAAFPIRTEENPLLKDETIHVTHKRAQQKMIAKAWHISAYKQSDYVALAMLGRILSAGKSSLLQEKLVNKAKTINVYADAFAGKDCGTFEFYAQLHPNSTFEEIESIVRDEIERCASGDVTDEQLAIAKNGLLKDYYQSITSPSALARILGDSFIFADDLGFSMKQLPLYEQITKNEISRVARKYISNAYSATVYLTPEQ